MSFLVAIYNTNPHYSDVVTNTTAAPVTTAPSSGEEIGVESRQESENIGIWLERKEDGYLANVTCIDIDEVMIVGQSFSQ